MAWPNTPYRTMVDGSTFWDAALGNALQSAINNISSGLASIAGLVIDGVGGVSQVARSVTSALTRYQFNSKALSLTDYMGLRTGPVLERQVDWASVYQQTTTGAVTSAYTGGWSTVTTTQCRAGYNGPGGGQTVTPTGAWASGSYIISLMATRTNTDKAYISSYPTATIYTGASLYNNTIAVYEWAMCPHGTTTATDLWVGLLPYATVTPFATNIFKAGVRFNQSTNGDTKYILETCDATTVNAVTTGVTPAAGTIVRCRLELHKSGSPFGACVRLFINGTLVTSSSNLPLNGALNGDLAFFIYAGSSNTGAESGIEIGPMRMLIPLYGGGLTPGATTSDV